MPSAAVAVTGEECLPRDVCQGGLRQTLPVDRMTDITYVTDGNNIGPNIGDGLNVITREQSLKLPIPSMTFGGKKDTGHLKSW